MEHRMKHKYKYDIILFGGDRLLEKRPLSNLSIFLKKKKISYLSIINHKNIIKVGISTSGSSPIMAKKIKTKTEKFLQKNISKTDLELIKIQKFARNESRKFISSQIERKKFLYAIMNDKRVKELLKEGKYLSLIHI